MTKLSRALRRQLAADFVISRLSPRCVLESRDHTRKLLFERDGGVRFEAVLIPDSPRLTLCVSSQAGCAMGCDFCATARLGLVRQLSLEEIVGQVLAARELLGAGARITNVVFMGMGEPLHNYENVVGAIHVLTAPWGLNMSPRRITVSTVGLLPQMERLIAETRVQLAVSLNSATEELRSRIMPINRKYSLGSLLEACRRLPLPQRRRVTFEYVLLAGWNDSREDADRLARLLRGVRCKVNLIPFNPFPDAKYVRPSPDGVEAFRARLERARIHATVRASRGADVLAACGQLAGQIPGEEGGGRT